MSNQYGIARYVRVDGKKRRSSEYAAWADMIQRCTNENNRAWGRYGGRGITVCDRWRDSFDAFVNDMGPRPPKASLDRIDNDGGYEPSNCRWSTERQQQRNKRDNHRVTIGDESLVLTDWAERYGISRSTLSERINAYGWDPVVAIQSPSGMDKGEAHRRAGVKPPTPAKERRRAKTGYRGVHPSGSGFMAVICVNRQQQYLGTFDTPEEAARVRDRKALELHGDKAVLNFEKKKSP